MRATGGGTQVLTFGIAVNDRRRNPSTGDWEDVPNFFDCVVFGARAEALSRFLSKGSKVAIEGKLRYSSWEREGQRRSKVEIIVDEIEFLSSRGAQQRQPVVEDGPYSEPSYSTPARPQASQRPAVQAPPMADVYDEDIPF